MPTITKRRTLDGETRFLATVRIQGFKNDSQTFATRKAAEGWARDQEQLLRDLREKRTQTRPDLAKLTLGQVLLEFLEDEETKRLRYYDDLHRLCAWWIQTYGTERAVSMGVLQVRAGRDKLRASRGPSTTNRYLSALRSCWNWARSAGLLPNDHLFPARVMLTEPSGRTRYLNDDELKALLEAAAKHSPLMRAAIVTSIATGLRQGELLRLNWADVDFDKQTLRVRITKNDQSRAVHLPKSACDVLRELKGSKVRALGAVFIGPDGARLKKSILEFRWKAVRTAAGLKDFRWHDQRHCCASYLAQEGATLMQIGAQLGHKSPSVTQRYAHLVEGAVIPAHAGLDEKLGAKSRQ